MTIMFTPNYEKQSYAFCRLKLYVEKCETNKDIIKISKVLNPTNERIYHKRWVPV